MQSVRAFNRQQAHASVSVHRCPMKLCMPCRGPCRSIVVKFQNDDEQTRRQAEEQARRQAEEEVIRKQEQELKELNTLDGVQADTEASMVPKIRQVYEHPGMDPDAPEFNILIPAFTRRREIFVGRIAMVGFFAACFWETILPGHPNIMEQVALPLEALGFDVEPSLITSTLTFLVIYNLMASLLPGSPTWCRENQLDIEKRPDGPPFDFILPPSLKTWLGITDWGFSKANELFHGRLAMLGFAAALVQQLRFGGFFGPGPLAQVARLMGMDATDTFYSVVPAAFAVFLTVVLTLAFRNPRQGRWGSQKDIY